MFRDTLLEKLPVTFRINPTLLFHQKVVAMLKDPNFIKKNAIERNEEV